MMPFLLILVYLAETLLAALLSNSAQVTFFSLGIAVFPFLFHVQKRAVRTPLACFGAALIAGGLVAPSGTYTRQAVYVLLCQLVQACASASAIDARKKGVTGTPFYTIATGMFVLALVVCSFTAFRFQELLPPLVGILLGILLLMSSAVLTDVGLRASLSGGGSSSSRVPAASRSTVLLIVSLALAISSMIAAPLMNSASHVREQVLARLADEPDGDPDRPPPPPKKKRPPPPRTKPRGMDEPQGNGGDVPATDIEIEVDVDGTPIYFVTISRDNRSHGAKGQQLYMRLLTEDTLGGWWTASEVSDRIIRDEDDGMVDSVVDLAPDETPTIEYRLHIRETPVERLPCIPGVQRLHMSGAREMEEDCYRGLSDYRLVRFAYDAASSPVLWQELSTRLVTVGQGGRHHLDTPDESAELLDAIVDKHTKVLDSDRDKINAIVGFFKEQAIVTSEPFFMEGRDGLSPILEYRQGNHTQMITALIMCLRAAGIPARRGSGHVAPLCNLEMTEYVFLNENASTWAEVPIDGKGWVIIDPWVKPAKPRPPTEDWPSDYYAFSDIGALRDYGDPLRNRLVKALRSMTPLLLTGIAILMVGGAMVLVRRPRTENERLQKRVEAPYEGAPSFCRMFYRHYEAAGCKKRKGMTPREYLHLLKSKGLVADEHDDIIDYLYRISYRGEKRQFMLENRFKTRFWSRHRQQDSAPTGRLDLSLL